MVVQSYEKKMVDSEKFLSFFTPGLFEVGVTIVRHLSAKDLTNFMQSCDKVEDFILDNDSLRFVFVKKAQKLLSLCLMLGGQSSWALDFIQKGLNVNHLTKKRKVKIDYLRYELELHCIDTEVAMMRNKNILIINPWDQSHEISSHFKQEFQKFVKLCTDQELKEIFYILGWFIFNRKTFEIFMFMFANLKNKSMELDKSGNTVLHILVKDIIIFYGGSPSFFLPGKLEAWIQTLPVGTQRCPTNKFGQSPLHMAVTAPHVNLGYVEILCKYMSADQFAIKDNLEQTALHAAVSDNNVNIDHVKKLCHYMTVDQLAIKDNSGRTALHAAVTVTNVDVELVKMICNYMTIDQIAMKDNSGKTAMCLAATRCNKLEIVAMLIQLMDQGHKLEETYLGRDPDTRHMLINISSRSLHQAVIMGNVKIVKMFCQHFNSEFFVERNQHGMTPLHYAVTAYQGPIEIVKTLCNHVTSGIVIQNNTGKTALHSAVLASNIEAVEILCNFMSLEQIEIEDYAGKTAMDYATSSEVLQKAIILNIRRKRTFEMC